MASNNSTYFAALEPEELAKALVNKNSDYYNFILKYGILDRWRRSYLAYYGLSESGTDTSRLNQAGTNGELFSLKINHFRSILENIQILITQNPPAMQPKASNTDSKSMNQTILAKSVLDYYMIEQKMEQKLQKACKFSLYAGEGFITQVWNATGGSIIAMGENNNPIYDGDVVTKVFHPIDVVRECNTNSTESSSQWYIIREWVNKYDLASKYPELSDDIISINKSPDYMSSYKYVALDMADPEYIPLYTFYHEESESLPNGRQFTFLTSDVYLTDGPLAYKRVPVHRIAPSDWDGTPFGYTVMYDLIGLQRAYDSLSSIITTNQLNYGMQNIVAVRGSELNVKALAQGLNLIEINPNMPEPKALNLLATAPELFQQMKNIVEEMQTLSGINSTARGNPEESLKSGTALALVASQAIQFNSGLQASYNNLMQSVGTGLIEILQMYAQTPRIAAIAGKSNRSRIKEFKGEDLESITRVTVEAVNPVSKSSAGRLQMAQDLLQMPNMITTPQHYFEVIETGQLEPMLEHETSQMLLIRSENEDLSEGIATQALVLDQHLLHIKEHSTVLDSPEARSNPQLVDAVTAHIMEHVQLLRTTDPQLLQVLGQQPLPPENQPPQGQSPQPQDPVPGKPINHGVSPQMANAAPAVEQKAQSVHPAQMPKLPKFSPPGLMQAYDKLTGNLG